MKRIQPVLVILGAAWMLSAGFGPEKKGQSEELIPPAQEDLKALFSNANGNYEKGEFEKAIKEYEILVSFGVEDRDLYYNLGNAHYKNHELGKAILFYEKALRLSPRSKDVKNNLALVRSLIKDKQFVKKEIWAVKAATWVHRNLSLNEALLLTSILYLILSILVFGFVFRESSVVMAIHDRFSIISPGRLLGLMPKQDFTLAIIVTSILFTASGTLSADKMLRDRQRSEAIIVTGEVLVYSAPSEDSTLQFKMHEGTQVGISERRNGWVRIILPGGLSGWIVSDSADAI